MAENVKCAFVAALEHFLHDDSCHPHRPEDVVRMGMCQIHIVYVSDVSSRFFQPGQDSVAPAGIHKQVRIPVIHKETGVVASGDCGASCAEHCYER